jgi:hypothetical protein
MIMVKKHLVKLNILAYSTLIIVIGLLADQIRTVEFRNAELIQEIISTEYKLLNSARTCELDKSMKSLKLFECRGVKRHIIDSLTQHLYHTNETLIKRDSTFVIRRYQELKQ